MKSNQKFNEKVIIICAMFILTISFIGCSSGEPKGSTTGAMGLIVQFPESWGNNGIKYYFHHNGRDAIVVYHTGIWKEYGLKKGMLFEIVRVKEGVILDTLFPTRELGNSDGYDYYFCVPNIEEWTIGGVSEQEFVDEYNKMAKDVDTIRKNIKIDK